MNHEEHIIGDSDGPDENRPEVVLETLNQVQPSNNNSYDCNVNQTESDHDELNSKFTKYTRNKQNSVLSNENYSSLQLRRKSDHALLKPVGAPTSNVDEDQIKEKVSKNSDSPRGFFRMACLNPTFGLHSQLMRTFGSLSAFIILFVLIISVIIVWKYGEDVKSINQGSFEDLIGGIKGKVARYVAESLTPTLIPEDIVRILHESVRDRFAGYPNDGDEFVPFFDIDSQTNIYPVIGVPGKPLPLDWQIEANVNNDNHEEHLQGRWSWFDKQPVLSTASPFYLMQGMCDPSVTDPSAMTYWENCTDANNDVSTGGVVTPSPTNNQIYRKSSSLVPILKAVFESHRIIKRVAILFANDGAGGGLVFPGIHLNGSKSYKSTGCEWMNEPNPYNPSRPIGTKEEIARCRPKGTVVSARTYNNLERDWCRRQAQNPFNPIVDGLYIDPWDGELTMSIGQGMYDRVTNDFIGCMSIGWFLYGIEEILRESRVTTNSHVSVARFDNGTTVASTRWNASAATSTVKIYDLNIGLIFESYQELKSLIDYDTIWNPREVREKYEDFTLTQDGFLTTAYPIPPVPESYDPSYKPLFFAILSTSEEDIFQVVDKVGLAIVLLVIYFMSKSLTAPLEHMNSTADGIITLFGSMSSSTDRTKLFTATPGYNCSPKTELDDVVQEFNQMVTSFSGGFASGTKAVKGGFKDIPNAFDMQKDFHELYESRNDVKFDYRVGKSITIGAGSVRFKNLGSNVTSNQLTQNKAENSVEWGDNQVERSFISRLFSWTVLLIGTPLLLTTIAMSAIVMYNMSSEFHSSIDAAKPFYLDVELAALSVYANLRANVVSSGTSRPIRDLYLLTRYASWLLFGGVERAASFTQVKTGPSWCKEFVGNLTECPQFQKNYFCDCAWNEPGQTCNNYTYDTRYRQDLWFSSEKSDFPNGDRLFTTFPNVSDSPDTVEYWEDARTLPGFEKGASASGYETPYDRLRVTSASPVYQVVYNQDVEKVYARGNFISFEADGMYLAFAGCSTLPKGFLLSFWSSTEDNNAEDIRPELCPIGKYGYDSRCRDWYDDGKKKAEEDGTRLHVTPPHALASISIGQIATSPLIDPQTKEHVGQVSIEIISGPLLNYLDDENTPLGDGGFPVLVTTFSGEDSVIAPGFSLLNESARPISELILPYDHECSEKECTSRRTNFEQILALMKDGENGNSSFTRISATGAVETVYITYAPVVLRSYRPVDSSDFSRGVELREVLIYSLALAKTEEALLEPFKNIEAAIEKKIRLSITLLSIIIFFSILFVIYFISVVTLSVSEPMLMLLSVIRSINRLDVNEEPKIVNHSNGSKEMITVTDTIQILYKVVRCGNYAFFSGNLERTYKVLRETCRLFHHLGNEKAMGVVSNNLGNLLLIAFREMDENGEDHFCGMTKADVISKGLSFYYDAIQLGENVYDKIFESEGLLTNCLEFMQHLSNRYFNRGMFLLTVKDGHTQPEELERLGFQDIDIATDLDIEIVNLGLKESWGHETSLLKKLDVDLVRVKGHLALQELGYRDRSLGEMLDNIFWMVKRKVNKDSSSPFFQTIMATGRLQEIETELIRYNLRKGDVKLAAQIGIRMLIEDEFIFPEAQEKAMEALSVHLDQLMEVDEDKRIELKRRLSKCQKTLERVLTFMEKTWKINLSELTAMRRSAGSSIYVNFYSRSSMLRDSRNYLTMEGF